MDCPKIRGPFTSYLNSSESSSNDEDSMFNKYSCTPPNRKSNKLIPRRRDRNVCIKSAKQISTDAGCRGDSSKPHPTKWQQRQVSLQREGERTMKRVASNVSMGSQGMGWSTEDELSNEKQIGGPGVTVETRNRFMSLSSRPVTFAKKRPSRTESLQGSQPKLVPTIQDDRIEFYDHFSSAIRLNVTDKVGVEYSREKSEEELLWQNELKDLLWLELQAWHSQRSPEEEDKFLFTERQKIPDVLDRIMTYHFDPYALVDEMKKDGFVTDEFDSYDPIPQTCAGCLDIFCDFCALNQSRALFEVGQLLDALEKVTVLYPSGRALSIDYPIYGSAAFVDRVKSMCLWYNVSRLLRLKTDIVGNMLISLGSKGIAWPEWPEWPHHKDMKKSEVGGFEVEEDDKPEKPDKSEEQDEEDDVCKADEERDVISENAVNYPGTELSEIHAAEGGSAKKDSSFRRHIFKRQTSKVHFYLEEDRSSVVTEAKLEGSPTVSWASECSCTDLPEADGVLKEASDSGYHVGSDSESISRSFTTLSADASRTVTPDVGLDYKKVTLGSAEGRLLYRSYLEKALKTNGLRKMLRWIVIVHRVNMMRAKEALRKPGIVKNSTSTTPPIQDGVPWEDHPAPQSEVSELQRYGTWSNEYQSLNLPSYRAIFLFLCRIPMEVIRECLWIRLEQKPMEPSAMSIRQLIQEFKEGLRAGVICKQKYCRDITAGSLDQEDSSHAPRLKEFDETLKQTLEAYLNYLQRWIHMGTPSSATQKNVLEQEWTFVRVVYPHIPSGEVVASKIFCRMASYLLSASGEFLKEGFMDSMTIQQSGNESTDEERSEKRIGLSLLRQVQCVFYEAREKTMRAISFAKTMRKDLEIAAEFGILIPCAELLYRLHITGHIRVAVPSNSHYTIFVPGYLGLHKKHLFHLLDLTSWTDLLNPNLSNGDSSTYITLGDDDSEDNSYILLVHCETQNGATIDYLWPGESLTVQVMLDDTIIRSHVDNNALLLIVHNNARLPPKRCYIENILCNALSLRKESRPSNLCVEELLFELKTEAIHLSQTIINTIEEVQEKCDVQKMNLAVDSNEQIPLINRWREAVRQCYKLGFEFHKDILRLVTGDCSNDIAKNVIQIARNWMKFAMERCERGRGLRPKWAAQGLEFLMIACEPRNTRHLSDEEFKELKESVLECISHVVGSPECNALSQITSSTPSSRSSSPTPLQRRQQKTSLSALPLQTLSVTPQTSTLLTSPLATRRAIRDQQHPLSSSSSSSNIVSSCSFFDSGDKLLNGLSWNKRITRAVGELEMKRHSQLEEKGLIGRVSNRRPDNMLHIRLKNVTFSWQRGTKIGQGRFGKVYIAINNRTGELMAMKEIALQPNDHKTVRSVADELRIFEGIYHKHLVRHYGVEICREEMIIFMEFCPEGTLENFVLSMDGGLPEELVRRYTRQLLEAVAVLHEHGIVHRDIKSANIFLTDEGHNLKLGDFGCAAKIRTHTTMAGELQGFVGTQAYMAPEVFTKQMAEGHGRAADIWSVGCVVIEMSNGKRPWHELETNYAIMYRVGSGEAPATPPSLSEEGKEFLSRIFHHDPKLRDTAPMLLDHNFVKIFQDDDNLHGDYSWPVGEGSGCRTSSTLYY